MSEEKKVPEEITELKMDQLEQVAGGQHIAASSRAILAEGANSDKLAYDLTHKDPIEKPEIMTDKLGGLKFTPEKQQ